MKAHTASANLAWRECTARVVAVLGMAILPMFLRAQTITDTISLKDGRQLKGTIVEEGTGGSMKFRLQNGVVAEVPIDEIDRISGRTPAASMLAMPPADHNTMLYERSKKNPGTAAALAMLLPSAGHLYAGNTGRGMLFLAGEAACAMLIASGIKDVRWLEEVPQYRTEFRLFGSPMFRRVYTGSITVARSKTEFTSAFTIGLVGVLAIKIVEMIDASAEARRFNERLHNTLFDALSEQNIRLDLSTGAGDGLAVGVHIGF